MLRSFIHFSSHIVIFQQYIYPFASGVIITKTTNNHKGGHALRIYHFVIGENYFFKRVILVYVLKKFPAKPVIDLEVKMKVSFVIFYSRDEEVNTFSVAYKISIQNQ